MSLIAPPPTANLQIPSYMVYGNLIYLVFVFFPLFFRSSVSDEAIFISVVGVLAYLPLHFTVFRATKRVGLRCAVAMLGIAFVVLPFNVGANTFIIYGVISATYFLSARGAISFWILAHCLFAAQIIYLNYPLQWLGFSMLLSGIGLMQAVYSQRADASRIQLEQSQLEVQRLARLAERERISRDLHDVLGHTMSLIVMKSELAHRLVASQPQNAAAHMHEVEITARAALQQIRVAVSGMRNISLNSELEDAQSTLFSAGIVFSKQIADVPLSNTLETTLALAAREAITNIIRHANAKNVDVTLTQRRSGDHNNPQVTLQISDDGSGGKVNFGNGLNGMRERIELLGGCLEVSSTANGGTRLALQCTNFLSQAALNAPLSVDAESAA